MIEIRLTDTEKSIIYNNYPNSTISEVQVYETSNTVDTVPFQFPLIGTEPEITTPYTGKGVKVAVIDSGIDAQHADLKVAGGVCMLTINCPTSPSYDDDNGHGTHVAGIIAAQKNNYGLIGIAPNVELYAVKVMTKTGAGTTTNIAAGVEWAIKQKIDIINMSIGTNGDDQALKLLLEKAYAEGITIVASAGNEGYRIQPDSVQFPAKYSSVIAVSATTGFNKILESSSIGSEVEIAAPGDAIISTYPTELDTIDGNKDGYAILSGTSMAAPHVTGVLALYKERFPNFTNKRLRELISRTAEDLGSTGRDPSFGFGLIKYKQEITEIPYPLVEEQDGKILISLQNSEGVINSQLISNNEIIQSEKPNRWELYRLKGDYTFTLTYLDSNNIQQKDVLHINVTKPYYLDIGVLKWYAPHVAYLSNNKFIFGHLDGSFKPDQLISRAEAVALLGRVYGLNGEQKRTNFSDVSASSFASGYIQSALDEGLLTGFPDNTFRPNQSVTRA
ncbi:MAG: S8 family serine peptidase, partial [Melioribacteraceae bacterium]|nr:S8 family serine peptidase [Melioribacteraceae bacterium]